MYAFSFALAVLPVHKTNCTVLGLRSVILDLTEPDFSSSESTPPRARGCLSTTWEYPNRPYPAGQACHQAVPAQPSLYALLAVRANTSAFSSSSKLLM